MGKSHGKGTILKQQNESWQLLALSLNIFLGLGQEKIYVGFRWDSIPMILTRLDQKQLLSLEYTCFYFIASLYSPQVHHGGAGTTAAGLKAAVLASSSNTVLCFSLVWLDLVFWFSLNSTVPNYSCSFLWWPTFLGGTSTCQRSWPSTHPSWWVLTSKIGECYKLYAWSQGKHWDPFNTVFNFWLLFISFFMSGTIHQEEFDRIITSVNFNIIWLIKLYFYFLYFIHSVSWPQYNIQIFILPCSESL